MESYVGHQFGCRNKQFLKERKLAKLQIDNDNIFNWQQSCYNQ